MLFCSKLKKNVEGIMIILNINNIRMFWYRKKKKFRIWSFIKNPIIGGIPEYLTININTKKFKYFLLSNVYNSQIRNIVKINKSCKLYKYRNHRLDSIDQLIRHINHVALLIERKAKVFFKSYKKIKYRLATRIVITITTNKKSFIFILKKINNKIKKAFWGPAIIKHVFHLE